MKSLLANTSIRVDVAPNDRETEPVGFAADELCRYLGRMLGGPVTTEPDDTSATIRLRVCPDEIPEDEGYEISVSGDALVITGGGPLGVVFGSYYFLERFGGCRFSGLGPDGEYVPNRDAVPLPAESVRRRPALWYRSLQFYFKESRDLTIRRIDWMAKNGMNFVLVHPDPDDRDIGHGPSVDPETGELREDNLEILYCESWYRRYLLPEIRKRGLKVDVNHHNIFTWLPPHRYFKAHPEWYPLVDGRRTAAPHQLSLCTSNREAVQTLIENMSAFLRRNPETGIIGVIPEDGGGWCLCEACRKQDEPADQSMRVPGEAKTPEAKNPAKVRRYARLLNEVAAALRDEFPDVKIGAAAYTDMIDAPQTVSLDTGVVPWVATYWRCGAHPLDETDCPVNPYFLQTIREWRARHQGRLLLYTYYMGMFSQYSIPFPIHETICRDWDTFKQMGLDGALVQSTGDSHHVYGINYLAFARCGWESGVDPDRVVEDFLLGLFGAAAPEIRPVFDVIHSKMRTNGEWALALSPDCLRPDASNILRLDPQEDIARFHDAIDRGLAAAQDERETRNLHRFRKAVQYWEAAWYVRRYRARREITERELGAQAMEAYLKVRAARKPMALPDPDDGWMVERVHLADASTEAGLLQAAAFRHLRQADAVCVGVGVGLEISVAAPLTITIRCDGGPEAVYPLTPGTSFKIMADRELSVDIPDQTVVTALAFNGIRCQTPWRAVRITAETDPDRIFQTGNPHVRWNMEPLAGE